MAAAAGVMQKIINMDNLQQIKKSKIFLENLVKNYELIFNKPNNELRKILQHLAFAEAMAQPLTDHDGDTVIRITKTQYEALLKQSEMLNTIIKSQQLANELNILP